MYEIMEMITSSKIRQNKVVEMIVYFNEINMNVDIRFNGAILDICPKRPLPEDILKNEQSYLQLAGYLAGKMADRITSSATGAQQHIAIHFDH